MVSSIRVLHMRPTPSFQSICHCHLSLFLLHWSRPPPQVSFGTIPPSLSTPSSPQCLSFAQLQSSMAVELWKAHDRKSALLSLFLTVQPFQSSSTFLDARVSVASCHISMNLSAALGRLEHARRRSPSPMGRHHFLACRQQLQGTPRSFACRCAVWTHVRSPIPH